MITIDITYAEPFHDPKLYTCQECEGYGGYTEVIIYETGQGPWVPCGWCNGTGEVDGPTKARWLNYRKYLKREGWKKFNPKFTDRAIANSPAYACPDLNQDYLLDEERIGD